MSKARSAPCGSWQSPLSAELASGKNLRLMQPLAHAGWTYWIESRPAEQGRCVLMRSKPDQSPQSLLPPPFSAHSRVHEYGGGAYAVQDDRIAFVNDADQQLYLLVDGTVQQLTNIPGSRFGDLHFDTRHQRLICIREQHDETGKEPVNSLVAVTLRDGTARTLAEGHDFYSSPALDHDARQLAWLQWDHPQMPWDGCQLCVAELDSGGTLKSVRHLAGSHDESVFQPQFAPDGVLHFITDRDGWWNIYKMTEDGPRAVTADTADYGLAQWNL
ncbi:MAG TPA: S9 family peptidase, partial [Gammaproteobacteria bacterium]